MIYARLFASLFPVVIVSLLAFLLSLFYKRGPKASMGLFVLFAIVSALLQVMHLVVPELSLADTGRNWQGKTLELIWSLGFIVLFHSYLPLEKVGLTLRQNAGSLGPALRVVLIYLGLVLVVGFAFRHAIAPKHFPLERLLWDTVLLPDFTEELAYRGIMLALLNQVFGRNFNFFGAAIGPGFWCIALLFGLVHGIYPADDGGLGFLRPHFMRTFLVSGLLYGWLKERTGSLLMPTLAHYGLEAILAIIIFFFT